MALTSGSVSVLPQQPPCAALRLSARALSTSSASLAAQPALSAVSVAGDLPGVLAEIDAVVSADGVSAKDVADAALSLAYLQAKGDRRVWGKVFEKAAALGDSFDAASLTTFLWAATAANVEHFKTLAELAGPAAKLLPSLSPGQLATVIEALGKVGVADIELFKAATEKVVPKVADYSASDLAKLLGGYASAGVADAKLTKAASGALVAKAGSAGTKELAQAAWALAKLGKNDTATLGALSKALTTKLAVGDAPGDAAAALWAFATLGFKPDAALLTKTAAGLKAGAGALSTEQAVYAAWSLALLGSADKDALGALLGAAGAAIAAAPDSVPIPVVAALYEATALAGAAAPKLPEQVAAYSHALYALTLDAGKAKRSAAAAAYHADVATATARALGAKYKPEVAAAVAALPRKTADGLPVELGAELDKSTNVAVLVLSPADLASDGKTPLGHIEAKRKLLDSSGYKAAVVLPSEWAKLVGDKAKAGYVLAAIKAAAPGASSRVTALQKELEKPFDPYAD